VGFGAGRASPAELLQFNLSQPVASVIIGCEQLAPPRTKCPSRYELHADFILIFMIPI
jgi:hypothetical protein